MRQVLSGAGVDTTATVAAALLAGHTFRMAHLYLIGEPEDPMAWWLTDYESPLSWPLWGTFLPANIRRGTVGTKIGLEVSSLDLTWSPKLVPWTVNTQTAGPYELANIGFYDNWRVRVWKTFMPTAGDANTWGAMELFGGRIADTTFRRGDIQFTVNSFLDVVNENVPTQTVEVTNALAAFKAFTPPAGTTAVPQFTIGPQSTTNVINAVCASPIANTIFPNHVFINGFVLFLFVSGSTLAGMFSTIQDNQSVTISSVNYNQFLLLKPMPWIPGTNDRFAASIAFPRHLQDGSYFGFPFVPVATSAL
jgi:hypothetical protein